LVEKTLRKIETKDADSKKAIEEILKKNGYNICPYVVRIYDFIGITGRGNGGKNGKQIAVQCLYKGTVHEPQELCLGDFKKCRKYKEIEENEEFMNR
jgi:hypothetical protein